MGPHRLLHVLTLTALALLLAILPWGSACGQGLTALFPEGVPGYGTSPGVTVQSRARAGREPETIHIGSLLFRPALEYGLGYDDNVLSSASRRGSWLMNTRPSLLLASNWSRDALGVYVAAADTRMFALPGQSRTDATVAVGGALDIGHDRLSLGFAHLNQHEPRGTLDSVAADRPIAFQLDDARAAYTLTFDRWALTTDAGLTRWQYDGTTIQGTPVSQSYRDRLMVHGGATLRFEWAPLRNLVFVTRALSQHYTARPPAQPTADATAYQMLVGVDYDGDAVWRYRLLLGGESRQFNAAAYKPHTAAIAEGELTWTPTGLTTVRGTMLRGVEDSAQEGTGGYTYTAGRLGVDHEWRRDWILSGTVEVRHAAYLQGSAQQTTQMAGVGLTWLFNRSAQLSATYDISRTRGGVVAGYARDLALLTVRLGL